MTHHRRHIHLHHILLDLAIGMFLIEIGIIWLLRMFLISAIVCVVTSVLVGFGYGLLLGFTMVLGSICIWARH